MGTLGAAAGCCFGRGGRLLLLLRAHMAPEVAHPATQQLTTQQLTTRQLTTRQLDQRKQR